MWRLFDTELNSRSRAGRGVEEIQEQAEERFDLLVEHMAEREEVTEQLKAQDQLLWVQRMNSIRARVEDIVREEIIYCL